MYMEEPLVTKLYTNLVIALLRYSSIYQHNVLLSRWHLYLSSEPVCHNAAFVLHNLYSVWLPSLKFKLLKQKKLVMVSRELNVCFTRDKVTSSCTAINLSLGFLVDFKR